MSNGDKKYRVQWELATPCNPRGLGANQPLQAYGSRTQIVGIQYDDITFYGGTLPEVVVTARRIRQHFRLYHFERVERRTDGRRFAHNSLAFINNVGVEIFNPFISLVNGAIIIPPQVMIHDGMGAFWDAEVRGMRAVWNTVSREIPNSVRDGFIYHRDTPLAEQWSDFKRGMGDIEGWERATAAGVGMFAGGYGIAARAGTAGRGASSAATRTGSSGMLGEPNVSVLRGVNSTAGGAYNRALSGVVEPRGGLFGHSNPMLHNSGQTANSRFTSWTFNSDIARHYALRGSGEGVILIRTGPISSLYRSPNQFSIKVPGRAIPISESETLLRGTIRKGITVKPITK